MFGQFTGGELLLRRSDRTLKQYFPNVRSDGDPASGRSKTKEIACIRLWLRPVGVHRTCLVAILGVLDLTGIDRTLGGSVRSLPLERPVNRKRAEINLLSPFPFLIRGGPHIIHAHVDLHLSSPRRHPRAAASRHSRRIHHRSPCPCRRACQRRLLHQCSPHDITSSCPSYVSAAVQPRPLAPEPPEPPH